MLWYFSIILYLCTCWY